ncbi:MAG: phosphate ABC transporter substrate-binding protein [Firmicutes bacterium]|nr:phosphate ABC transporter substrate-binding protein [Bacillota bacterium]
MKQKRWLALFGAALLVLALLVTGCGQSEAPMETETEEETGAEEAPEAASIMIAGSDSEVNLVTRLAEEYMIVNPHVAIAVTGGGSGVGISSLIDGGIDIANSSRPMKEAEEADLKEKQGQDTHAVRFAVDGVAVVVNKDNPVAELTVDQIGAIYRGEIANWSEVGGEDLAITLYGRQSTSGTYVFFMEKVVQADYSPEMRNLAGTSDIVEAVTNDLGGIGYAAIGYATKDGIKAVLVAADEASEAFDPTILENVTSGDYPLTRPLYQFVIGKPSGAILDFLLYEVSEAGQQLVLNEGFYPITNADVDFNKKALQ